jgi:endonuclease/exonuclease/phosphatase family metal-dependent hydrolase
LGFWETTSLINSATAAPMRVTVSDDAQKGAAESPRNQHWVKNFYEKVLRNPEVMNMIIAIRSRTSQPSKKDPMLLHDFKRSFITKILVPVFLAGITSIFLASVFGQANPPGASHAGSLATAPQIRGFTIAFWNIQWFPGNGPDASSGDEYRQINAVHSDIARIAPDILGMEEVRNFEKASLAVQPLKGFKVDVCANFPPREGQNVAQEPAIASRLQASSAWAEEWKSAGAITPPRGFAFAAYQLQPGQMLLVYCVHFKSNLGEIPEVIAIRQESTRQLLSHIAAMRQAYGKMGQIACVIGGDFNTSLEDNTYAAETTLRDLVKNGFLWAWQSVAPSSRMTLPPSKKFPATCFDHMFYQGLTLRRAAVVSTTPQSSDHHAIVATFDVPAARR